MHHETCADSFLIKLESYSISATLKLTEEEYKAVATKWFPNNRALKLFFSLFLLSYLFDPIPLMIEHKEQASRKVNAVKQSF